MSRPLPARFRSSVVGKLEMVALRDTRRGLLDCLVPAGTVGYALAARDGVWLVFWPALREASAHPRADLRPTGRRGAWPVTG